MIERIYDLMAVILLFAINLIWFKPPASLLADFGRIRALGVVSFWQRFSELVYWSGFAESHKR
jgi:hypothetical protein